MSNSKENFSYTSLAMWPWFRYALTEIDLSLNLSRLRIFLGIQNVAVAGHITCIKKRKYAQTHKTSNELMISHVS